MKILRLEKNKSDVKVCILICDIHITGHHSEYVGHLIDYLHDYPTDDHFYFLLHPDFSDTFPLIRQKADQCTNIELIHISHQEYDHCNRGGKTQKSIRNYRMVNRYVGKLSVQHVILLHFNLFQFALGVFTPKYTVSGILFAQFYRLTVNSWSEKIRYWRKYIQTWLYARNKKIKTVFILNDHKAVLFLNAMFRGKIFQMLPDPVPEIEPLANFDIRQEYQIEPNRKIFLHTGSLDGRKGTLDILRSIDGLCEKDQKQICFLFVGKASIDFEQELSKSIEHYQNLSFVQIIRDNRFVSKAQMKCLFEQCDCVLIPYKNPESSSGILGHAAKSGKPVIGSDKGLLGSLIKEERLGYAVDDTDGLSKAILKILEGKYEYKINELFLNSRSVCSFSDKLIKSSQITS